MKNLLFAMVLLTGCSSIPGVVISDDERKACETAGCTVWSMDELESLARRFLKEGYTRGVKSI